MSTSTDLPAEMPVPVKKKKKKSRARIFITAFLASAFVGTIIVAVAGSVFASRVVIVPPEIPTVSAANIPRPTSPSQEEYIVPWDYGLIAPARFTDEDRRENFFTFMIIGLNEGTNANTVMVASYNANEQKAYLVSIPRDSLIDVQRFGRKLGSSYIAGSAGDRGRAGGIQTLQRDIQTVIGFVPDFYIMIDYDAFFAIIDAVGGIEIYVPFHMRYEDPHQDLFINIPPGLQLMDSETALHFSRFRQTNIEFARLGYRSLPNSDYGRIENQQLVIIAVIEKLLSPQSLLMLPEFVDIFNETVDSNLTVGNMLWFARELNNIRNSDALSTYTTPMAGTSGAPMWYEILHAPGVLELVNRTINPFYRDIEMRDISIVSN